MDTFTISLSQICLQETVMSTNLRPVGAGGSAQEDMEKIGYLGNLLMPDIGKRLYFLTGLIIIFAGWATCGIEVFTRHRFGVRYFNIVRAFMGFVVMTVLFLVTGYPVYTFYFDPGGLLLVMLRTNPLVQGYVGLSIAHLLYSWWRSRRQIEWHTRSFGVSNLTWIARRLPINATLLRVLEDEWLVFRLIEPLALVVVGILIRPFNAIFANWIALMAFLLWLKNNMLYFQQLNALYDRADANIEATFWSSAMSGAPLEKTAGFTVVKGIPGLLDKIAHAGTDGVKATVANTMKRPSEHRNSGD
jgi:hypothetical protein